MRRFKAAGNTVAGVFFEKQINTPLTLVTAPEQMQLDVANLARELAELQKQLPGAPASVQAGGHPEQSAALQHSEVSTSFAAPTPSAQSETF